MDKINLINDDCITAMKCMPDCSVDMALTDPPYMLNHTTGGIKSIGMSDRWQGLIRAGNSQLGFDTSVKFIDWMPSVYRVLKPKGHFYVFCNDKNVRELLNVAADIGFRQSNILVWVKNNATPNRYYMKNCEFILFLYKERAKPINNMGDKAVIVANNIYGKNKLHPTQKPVEIIERLILNSTMPGDTVFDPFMGSGSTGVACVNTGRNFIGIELDTKYFNIASSRIEEGVLVKNG
jgi:site-specific DNA-methyltransferase (adenine-specific)